MSKQNTSGGGVGILGLLFVAFVVLKLTHVIAWSWIWVLAPIWIPFAVVIVAVLCIILLKIIS